MKEADWATSVNASTMWNSIHPRGSLRKLRLFQVACCRSIWHLMSDDRSQRAVEAAEWYAEGCLGMEELEAAWNDAKKAEDQAHDVCYYEEARSQFCWTPAYEVASIAHAAASAARAIADPELLSGCFTDWPHLYVVSALTTSRLLSLSLNWKGTAESLWEIRSDYQRAFESEALGYHTRMMRDLFGNSYRPIVFSCNESQKISSIAGAFAETIYERGRFDEMKALADLLDTVEGVNEALLSHLRISDLHVRGCWVLDLLLDKK